MNLGSMHIKSLNMAEVKSFKFQTRSMIFLIGPSGNIYSQSKIRFRDALQL